MKKKKSTNKKIKEIDQSAQDKILQVAESLFAQEGFDGVTTRMISQKSGLNISLISYYFGGKEGLYLKILENLAEDFKTILMGQIQKIDYKTMVSQDFESFLKNTLALILRRKLKNPDLVKLLVREHLSNLANIRDRLDDVFEHLGLRVDEVFEAGKKRGFVKKEVNSRVFMILLMQAVDGYIVLQSCANQFAKKAITLNSEENQQKFLRQVEMIFIKGVLK